MLSQILSAICLATLCIFGRVFAAWFAWGGSRCSDRGLTRPTGPLSKSQSGQALPKMQIACKYCTASSMDTEGALHGPSRASFHCLGNSDVSKPARADDAALARPIVTSPSRQMLAAAPITRQLSPQTEG